SGLGAVVFHSANGKGVHPQAVGMPWSRATSDASDMGPFMHPAFAEADGLLAVGCRFTQLTTGSWKLPVPEQLVHLDIDPAEIGRHYRPAVGLVGDAKATLRALVPPFSRPRPAWGTWPPPEPWTLGGMDLVEALRPALPDDAILAIDVTRAAYLLMSRLPLAGRRSWLHPAGSVAMGYAVPAALGAKAAFPERPVVAVVGDGGLQMSALEMATAVQEGLPVVIVLFNDSCLTLIKATQERHYPGRTTAVELRNPDFGRLAGAFGFDHLPATGETLGRALRDAIASCRPALIEVTWRD
ncbi:MAG: thiamine pyrophosphate-binding protein, partial [Gemmataceae bacterium]